jgi:hypothetical protein
MRVYPCHVSAAHWRCALQTTADSSPRTSTSRTWSSPRCASHKRDGRPVCPRSTCPLVPLQLSGTVDEDGKYVISTRIRVGRNIRQVPSSHATPPGPAVPHLKNWQPVRLASLCGCAPFAVAGHPEAWACRRAPPAHSAVKWKPSWSKALPICRCLCGLLRSAMQLCCLLISGLGPGRPRGQVLPAQQHDRG